MHQLHEVVGNDNGWALSKAEIEYRKFSKIDADSVAQDMQAAGKDVEVYHKGLLQYRLSGIYQGDLFQQ